MKTAALVMMLGAFGVVGAHSHTNLRGDNERCGTEHNEEEIAESIAIASRFTERVCTNKNQRVNSIRTCLPASKRVTVNIPVIYHVIHSGTTGNLTDEDVEAQVDQTNKDFRGEENQSIPGYADVGMQFTLEGITRTDNALWFSDGDRYESQFKAALAVDNSKYFNQYFTDFSAGLLGFCYFPNSFAESSVMHGCVNLYSSIPGGATFPYNEGKTTTHETGHGIGLYHTFQGGCFGAGDRVDDTCQQRSPTSGCPSSPPASCGLDCVDPVNNYMDYSTDTCMTQFTEGQAERAYQQLSTYRPSLYLSADEIAAVEEEMPDAWDEAKAFQAKAEAKYMAKKFARYGHY